MTSFNVFAYPPARVLAAAVAYVVVLAPMLYGPAGTLGGQWAGLGVHFLLTVMLNCSLLSQLRLNPSRSGISDAVAAVTSLVVLSGFFVALLDVASRGFLSDVLASFILAPWLAQATAGLIYGMFILVPLAQSCLVAEHLFGPPTPERLSRMSMFECGRCGGSVGLFCVCTPAPQVDQPVRPADSPDGSRNDAVNWRKLALDLMAATDELVVCLMLSDGDSEMHAERRSAAVLAREQARRAILETSAGRH